MNNKEFISTLAADTGYTQTDTQKMVNNVIEAMKKPSETATVCRSLISVLLK